MEQKKPRQAVYISTELVNKLMILRGRINSSTNKVKLYQLIEEAVTKYLEEQNNELP